MNPYIPWDVPLFYSALGGLRSIIGIAVNVGLWAFVVITGIYVVIKIVNSLIG